MRVGLPLAFITILAAPALGQPASNAPQGAAKLVSVINQSIQIGLICAAIIPLYDVWKQVRRLYRGKTGQAAPVLTVS